MAQIRVLARPTVRYDSAYKTPLPAARYTLLSQQEMEARIEAARLDEAPARCPTCGSGAADPPKPRLRAVGGTS